MLSAFLTGFVLGFSLILAIGAQNSFVLKQGLIGRHVFIVALFCSLSDAFLITLGVFGISLFFSNNIDFVSNWLFGISSVWLGSYGFLRLRDVFNGKSVLVAENSTVNGLFSNISFLIYRPENIFPQLTYTIFSINLDTNLAWSK